MNILLTSAGRRSYLVDYFIDALEGSGLVHASNSEWTTALEAADEAVITPLIYDENYIDFLLSYCEKHDISVVISLFDIDLPVLAKNKKSFRKKGIDVIVSDYKVTQICNDKWKSYLFLKENGFKTPLSFLTLDSAKKALEKKELDFPVIIKPRWGMGSISIFKADNAGELEVLFAKVKREVHESYLKYESQSDPESSVIIQQFLNGQEYGLDIINNLDQNHIATLVKKKMAMKAGETEGAVTVKHNLLEKTGQQIAASLKHIGNLDTDCFIVNDEAYILEMNCRFGGGYPFSHLAGADVPKAILAWIEGKNTDFLSNYKIGIAGNKDISIREMKSPKKKENG